MEIGDVGDLNVYFVVCWFLLLVGFISLLEGF